MERTILRLISSALRDLQLQLNGTGVVGATKLSALLSGCALDVYSRLSEEVAIDYDQLNEGGANEKMGFNRRRISP